MQHVSIEEIRSEQLDRLSAEPLDVLVIGGGIIGAGIAREAALRGLRVALVEQHDLASGTSSRSSRLLHGGLRYLAQGRLGLVRQASREKGILHRIAAHLAEPLPFVFPAYRGTPWPLWQLRAGVKLYDLLCGGRNLGPSSCMSAAETAGYLPGINTKDLAGAVRYFDGLTNDSRLVLDTLRSAARLGAIICNYTRMEEASIRAAGWQCRLRDVPDEREFAVVARSVVNAAGPWADKFPQSRLRLRLTKGVHLVIDRRRLPLGDAVVMAKGKRILFAIPWGERVILGTTDTDYSGRIESVRTEPEDVRYILEVADAVFPNAALAEPDVISSWAGLRPLIASGRGGPSDISRAHTILSPQPGWFDVAGGKLTTYRLIAEQAVERLLKWNSAAFPARRSRSRPALRQQNRGASAAMPLLPPEQVGATSGILPPQLAKEIVEHYCTDEWVVHLDDVMCRRTSWHYYLRDAGEAAQRVAGWMADILGWDDLQRKTELSRYRQLLQSVRS